MSRFDEITGTNEYQRQSWRDNYNGGRAAGDVTGNVNARIDSEREAFGGHTISGSSSDTGAALWLAQQLSGGSAVGAPSGTVGTAPVSSGPGNPVVTQGPVVPGRSPAGGGPGAPVSRGPLIPSLTKQITEFMLGGLTMRPHPGTSNMAEVEDRWGDAEFLSPAWFTSWGIAALDGWHNLGSGRGGPLKTDQIEQSVYNAPGWMADGVRDLAGYLDGRKVQSTERPGLDGGSYFTGGGF